MTSGRGQGIERGAEEAPLRATSSVPAATRAVIGGSGSLAADFPRRLAPRRARSWQADLVFDTPWGDRPPFTLFELGGQRGRSHVQDARLAHAG